jgi:hypothetical protein
MKLHSDLPVYKSTYDLLLGYLNLPRVLVRNIITEHNYENVISISTKLVLMKGGKAQHLKNKTALIEKDI